MHHLLAILGIRSYMRLNSGAGFHPLPTGSFARAR